MKTFTTLFIMILFSGITITISAQTPDGKFDEMIGKEIISSNIFLLWQEETPDNALQAFQKVYRFGVGSDSPVDQRFADIPAKQDARPVGGNRHMVVTPGKFVVSPFDYVIAAWEGQNQTIELMIPHMDSTEVMWNSHTAFTVDGPVIQTDGNNERGRIFIQSGDMNGNGLDEFALVYHGADSTIHIQVYDLDENLTPRLLASINDEQLIPPDIGLARISVAVGDVNGSGRDEIILSSLEVTGEQSWAWGIYVKTYELDNANNLIEQARETIFFSDPNEMQISGMDIAVETGNFRDESKQDIVLATTFSTNAFEDDTFIYLIELDGTSGTLIFDPEKRVSMQKSVNERSIIDLAIGDLNNDGHDEFVFALSGSFEIYTVDEELNPVYRSVGSLPDNDRERLSYDFISIAELDQDQRPEIIAVRNIFDQSNNSEQWFELVAYSVHDAGNGVLNSLELIGRKSFDQPSEIDGAGSARRYAIATGSFNGFTFRVGDPVYSIATDIVQPLVILNAPPVHFDIFDGVSYDVNQCYSGVTCNFVASYKKANTTAVEISTEVKSAWGVSAGVGISGTIDGSVSVKPFGVGVGGGVSRNYEAYFDGTYGRNFSNRETESHTTTITVAVDAVEDDIIFATVTDYEIWEYPAFHGNEAEPRFHIVAKKPRIVASRWFPSKSWSANMHIPDHEVGNIISYPAYPDLSHNPNLDQNIRASYSSDTFVVDQNTSYGWSVNIESFNQSEADTSRNIGFDYKNHVSNLRLSGNYNDTRSSTHTTTVKEGIEISIQLGGIDRTYGETRYHVTPYSYWANNGALVVDYAVQPEVSGPGGISTWWDEHYGQLPDPAFILPWRYDPEKGFGIGEEAKRHQTQDVFFDFNEPEPGDTLTVTARVRNFSLVDSPPVTVHFYVGDPDEGGTPITSLDGETSFITDGGIPAQRFSDVEIEWQVPNGITQYPRIYAVLNQDSTFEEIHTNNNKGFNILGQTSVSTSNEEIADISRPDSFKLHQSYPNPFNPTTTITYELPHNTAIKLEVFNVLGQRVATLVDGVQPSGFHEVRFDASSLSSGLYLYRLTTESFSETKRMMLIK